MKCDHWRTEAQPKPRTQTDPSGRTMWMNHVIFSFFACSSTFGFVFPHSFCFLFVGLFPLTTQMERKAEERKIEPYTSTNLVVASNDLISSEGGGPVSFVHTSGIIPKIQNVVSSVIESMKIILKVTIKILTIEQGINKNDFIHFYYYFFFQRSIFMIFFL